MYRQNFPELYRQTTNEPKKNENKLETSKQYIFS